MAAKLHLFQKVSVSVSEFCRDLQHWKSGSGGRKVDCVCTCCILFTLTCLPFTACTARRRCLPARVYYCFPCVPTLSGITGSFQSKWDLFGGLPWGQTWRSLGILPKMRGHRAVWGVRPEGAINSDFRGHSRKEWTEDPHREKKKRNVYHKIYISKSGTRRKVQ